VSDSFLHPPVVLALALPIQVIWCYLVGGSIFAIGLATVFLRGDWQKARGLDKLVIFGPVLYASPLAAFGSEHFTLTAEIASIIPRFVPWHLFWTYFIGACFIAAALSLVTGIQARLSASLLALNFFLFVALMDAPAWAQNPRDRFAIALALRELSFCAGPLALAASLSPIARRRIATTIARYFIAVPVLFYSFEQFLHADHVPCIPLPKTMPAYIFGHALWTYLAAAVYAVAGIFLLAGRKTRSAASWLGFAVVVIILIVYVPIAIVERASLEGFNYLGDTLMYGGAILLLAGAMPRAGEPSSAHSTFASQSREKLLEIPRPV